MCQNNIQDTNLGRFMHEYLMPFQFRDIILHLSQCLTAKLESHMKRKAMMRVAARACTKEVAVSQPLPRSKYPEHSKH